MVIKHLLLLVTVVHVELLCQAGSFYNNGSSNQVQSNNSCAPGFSGNPCKCDALDYTGMRCYKDRAYVIGVDYWVGECENGTLCTSKCPLGFCAYNGSTDIIPLPASMSDLNDYVCDPTRTGMLCGECRANHSVSYHSLTFKCIPDNKCNYGPLLYIVSELIPLTVMFVIIIAFNISFTSGAVNGFIFFAQVQDTLGAHPDGIFARNLYDQFFYRFFDFDFFDTEELSFCLWRGATTLDTLVLKYVTITYAFILVLICVFIVNSPKVKRRFPCLRPTSLSTSLVHGLTSFFIMCYSQCTRVSFGILRSTSIYAKYNRSLKTVVFVNGQFSMLGSKHLKYAIPALFFGSAIVILPPVVLISYPLLCKILARCNMSESKPVNCVSRLVPMQLLDSFQSSFRDEVRFFAGLYFVYRLVPQIIWSISFSIDNYRIALSSITLMLVLTLALHAAVQPYKQRTHNVLDVVILADLVTICTLALSDLQSTIQGFYIISSIQLALYYLPPACLLSMGLFRVLKAVVRYCKTKLRSRQETTPLLLTDSSDLPPLREE